MCSLQGGKKEMADEQSDRLETFRAFIRAAEEGAPIPPVAEDDLRRLHEVSQDMAKRRVGKDGIVSVEMMARICSAGANLPAVWLRYTRLRSLTRRNVLAEWQYSPDFDRAVYHVAATIPINGFRLDEEAFVQRLRYESAA